MKNGFRGKTRLAAVLFALLLLGSGCVQNGESEVLWQDFYNDRAEAFITVMANGDFDAAEDMLDEAMLAAGGATLLQEVWETVVIAQAGAFVEIYEVTGDVWQGDDESYFFSWVTSRHEESDFTLRIVLLQDGRITGLFLD